ncbi:hypothetical protein BRADI_3g30795v3 [Brachypodium distachyon]|uniref:Uncharacterized protein n=1 Tax=Brachypodium distachyon TaxID=15368 RepID=A0A2K2D0B2_BRADI|nr:hypothetical protein BRADI_3g30795v3 [Brachypodium distachyon]
MVRPWATHWPAGEGARTWGSSSIGCSGHGQSVAGDLVLLRGDGGRGCRWTISWRWRAWCRWGAGLQMESWSAEPRSFRFFLWEF